MAKCLRGYFEEKQNIRKVAEILKSGGTAVLPTDTIYGFHCISSDSKAIDRIKTLKGEMDRVGFIVLASDMKMVEVMISNWPGDSFYILRKLWPATFTAVLPAAMNISTELSRDGKVAIRIPALLNLRRVIKMVRIPLVSTSVNRSGQSPMRAIRIIRRRFPGLQAYISSRKKHTRLASTIVDFTESPPSTIRKGRWESKWSEYIS